MVWLKRKEFSFLKGPASSLLSHGNSSRPKERAGLAVAGVLMPLPLLPEVVLALPKIFMKTKIWRLILVAT